MASTIVEEATMERSVAQRIPPVVRTVEVRWPRAEAFERFTAGIARWWPLRTHSVGQASAQSVVFEDEVGGRIYEVEQNGDTHTWGTILEWDPPSRVRFTWHPGRQPDTAQQVEVRFADTPGGSRLTLTHEGWEKLGRLAARARFGYNFGWIPVLDEWADRKTIAGSILNGLGAVAGFIAKLRPGRRNA
jgi:uncharacterized protein YndB with AHSA1/START domain